jgi:hypothetical protein
MSPVTFSNAMRAVHHGAFSIWFFSVTPYKFVVMNHELAQFSGIWENFKHLTKLKKSIVFDFRIIINFRDMPGFAKLYACKIMSH